MKITLEDFAMDGVYIDRWAIEVDMPDRLAFEVDRFQHPEMFIEYLRMALKKDGILTG